MGALKHAIIPCPDCHGEGCIETTAQGFIDSREPTTELHQCLTCAGIGEIIDPAMTQAQYDSQPGIAWIPEAFGDEAPLPF